MAIRASTKVVLVLALFLVSLLIWQFAPRAIPHLLYRGLDRVDRWMSDCPKPNESRFWTADPASTKAKLVVFVHGIFGDPTCTWTSGSEAHTFAKVIQSDTHIARAFDIYSFGYPSAIFDEFALTPEQAAAQLGAFLEEKTQYTEIVFVTHSMGALVALEAAAKSSNVARRTSMILALSPPLDGSEMAAQGKRLWLPNPALELLFPPKKSDAYLAILAEKVKKLKADSRAWADEIKAENKKKLIPDGPHRVIPGLSIHCAGENRPTAIGATVVTELQSSLCSTKRHFNRDHSDISKPRLTAAQHGLADDPVSFVVGHLRKRTGPNPGLSATVHRFADYSEAQCNNGMRNDVELLTDTYHLSSVPADTIFQRALVGAGKSVSLIDLMDAGAEKVVQPLKLEEDLCLERTLCDRQLTYSGLRSSGSELKFRWEWKSSSEAEIDGVVITSQYPLTKIEIEVLVPPDSKVLPRESWDLKRSSASITCSSPVKGDSRRITYSCKPIDSSKPLYGPVSLYYGKTVDIPKCPGSGAGR